MDRLVRMFFRLCVICLAFIFACLVASISTVTLGQLLEPGEAASVIRNGPSFPLVIAIIGLASVIGAQALLPAVLVIFYAEVSQKRDWLFYAVAAALIAGATVAFAVAGGAAPTASFSAKLIASGIFGGLAYWLLAGRSAGLWLPSEQMRTNATSHQSAKS